MKTKLLLTLIILSLKSGITFGQQDSCFRFPAQFTFIYPVGTHGMNSDEYRYHFSFNTLMGSTCGLDGLEIAGLLNINSSHVKGIQVAGIGNRTAGNVKGIQVGGIFGIADSAEGVQVHGIINKVNGSSGIQVAGITNINEGNAKGIQVAGITNVTGQGVNGIQIAGIANINNGTAEGIRVAGILNSSAELNGLQIGLINITDTVSKGISIGLINIVKNGSYDEFVFSVSDYQNIGFSYKAGTKSFYNIYSAGKNFVEDDLWSAGLGFGHVTDVNKSFSFQPEVIVYSYFPENFRRIRDTYTAHIRFGFVHHLSDKLALSFAPGVYGSHKSNRNKYSTYGYEVSPFKSFAEDRPSGSNAELAVGFGLQLGLIIK